MFGKKTKTYELTLVSNAKKYQEALELTKDLDKPVKVNFGLHGGKVRLMASKSSKEIGNFPKNIEGEIFKKYEKSNGLSCKINVLASQIKVSQGEYSCALKIEVIPE